MKLNDLKDQFDAIHVGVAGMTYDSPEIIRAFDKKWDIRFPVLKDVDHQHVEAWGVRKQEYGPGTFGYGIPYPGVVLISTEGKILAKWSEERYRSRAAWSQVLEEVASIVSDG